MARRLVLLCLVVLCVLLASSSIAATQQATIVIRPGDNWVSTPLVPIGWEPTQVFAPCISQCTLRMFDAPSQAILTYPQTDFAILLGEGYKMYNPTTTTFYCTYMGVADGVPDSYGNMSDMWVSLPGDQTDDTSAGGMHWVGHPFYHSTQIANCSITDGNYVWPIADAVSLGIIDGLWPYLDAETQTMRTAGVGSLGADDTFLVPTRMYEIRTHRDNLAMIIPGYPVPEPCSTLALICGLGSLIWRRKK